MRRARPRQHRRKLKSGKTIVVNKGRRKVKKRRMVWARGVDAEAAGPEIKLPFAGKSADGETAYEKKRVLMPVDKFLQRQFEQSGYEDRKSFNEWLESGKRDPVMNKLRNDLPDPKQHLPIPFEEYEVLGKRRNHQEGRKRGIVVKELGGDVVPVMLIRRKTMRFDRENEDDLFTHRDFDDETKAVMKRGTEWDAAVNEFPEDENNKFLEDRDEQ